MTISDRHFENQAEKVLKNIKNLNRLPSSEKEVFTLLSNLPVREAVDVAWDIGIVKLVLSQPELDRLPSYDLVLIRELAVTTCCPAFITFIDYILRLVNEGRQGILTAHEAVSLASALLVDYSLEAEIMKENKRMAQKLLEEEPG